MFLLQFACGSSGPEEVRHAMRPHATNYIPHVLGLLPAHCAYPAEAWTDGLKADVE